jgi:hypothetical protein
MEASNNHLLMVAMQRVLLGQTKIYQVKILLVLITCIEFFTIPRLTQQDADAIMNELKTDMEQSWTPSKLVETLNKHIIS